MATPAGTRSPSRRKKGQGAIERTLAGISASLEDALFAEQISRQRGLLQSLDPRLKVAATLLLLIAVGLSHSLAIIAGLYIFALLLAWASAVPLGFFVKRVWLLLPFFTLIIAIPAIFITPGPALAALPLGLTITRTGVTTALFLLLRVGTSVSLAILLVLTTPWNSVLKALGGLRVPDVVVLILGMTYRYIYLFLHIANDMFLSRKSRLVRHPGGKAERQMISASVGVMLSKSLSMSSEVYLAMQSRGFRGYPRTMDTFSMRRLDWLAGLAVVLVAAAAIWLGR